MVLHEFEKEVENTFLKFEKKKTPKIVIYLTYKGSEISRMRHFVYDTAAGSAALVRTRDISCRKS
jgi:hypothetical protein